MKIEDGFHRFIFLSSFFYFSLFHISFFQKIKSDKNQNALSHERRKIHNSESQYNISKLYKKENGASDVTSESMLQEYVDNYGVTILYK